MKGITVNGPIRPINNYYLKICINAACPYRQHPWCLSVDDFNGFLTVLRFVEMSHFLVGIWPFFVWKLLAMSSMFSSMESSQVIWL